MIRVIRVGEGWRLVGEGEAAEAADQFIRELAALGRSTYTQRSYAMGLAAFLRWLAKARLELDRVTRQVIVEYTRSLVISSSPLSPTTVNHRLSVLSSFFAWWAAREEEAESDGAARRNPVPGPIERPVHGAAFRDAPRRERSELRRRVARRVPRTVDGETASRLVEAAPSVRDRAILTLLWRTGARIGDWISESDRQGVLGLACADLDERSRRVRVRLKGARDEHQIPVTDDFWPLWHRYLAEERRDQPGPWAWAGQRRGRSRPLRYHAFAAMLHAAAEGIDLRVHAHMFRHGLAEAVTAVAGIHVTKEVLGHRHLGTTADFYARVDAAAMVAGIEGAARRRVATGLSALPVWAFSYDEVTLDELGRLTAGREGSQ